MTINDTIKIIAGLFILTSLTLGYYVNDLWFLFTLFVGVNLMQSSLTKWCLLEKILKKIGMKEGGDSCSI
ncbi:DUF2892 domain-containing protein [Flavobacteriales bacterium]|nr:DUF2892 domain-containing protein [Flavobacteriales bacterium]MDB4088736.1 DUF2892 domain-containing protein [Flavobacteriales bacterium]